MRLRLIRRLRLVRLALSFVFDYWRIRRLNQRLSGEERVRAVNRVCEKAGQRMRVTAFRMKGVLVKAGQFLSMRKDLLPDAFTEELVDLQDALPVEPFPTIRRLIENEWGNPIDEVFQSFEREAVAAASLAQVHRAVLKDGTKVAVKILRPRMEEMAQADLDSLGSIAKVTQRIPGLGGKIDFVKLHHEFTETIHRELNGNSETKSLHRFAKMFSKNERIVIPKVFQEYTTKRMLVMEYLEGAKVTDLQQLSKWKVDQTETAKTLLEIYLQQFLIYGFIHVDPHPGNVLILPDHRIGLLDFGMVNELSLGEVATLRSLLQNIVFQNEEGILSAFERLGFLHTGSDRTRLKPVIHHVFRLLNGGLEEKDYSSMNVSDVKAILRDPSLHIQANYLFMIRGVGMLIPILAKLVPKNDWMSLLWDLVPSIMSSSIQAGQGETLQESKALKPQRQ